MGKFIVFDGNSILNRAFYGVRPLNTKDGFPTNALFGFINILRKNLNDTTQPFTHGAIAFDTPAKTFRHMAADTYKATRKGMPEDLAKQLPVSKEIASSLGLTVLEKEGYEADDIIGTIARLSGDAGMECIVVTGDRDSYQLVNEKVTVRLAATNETKIIGLDAIKQQYNLEPRQLIDLKAIMGDSSDNIKGVAGIGEKGALALICEYGSLDGVYENLDKIKPALSAKLAAGRDDAYLSRFLAEINKNVPVSENLSDYEIKGRDDGKLLEIFTRLEFSSLINSFNLEKPKEKAINYIKSEIYSATLLSLTADTLYVSADGERLEVFDGENIYTCPLDQTSAKLFTGKKHLVLWSVKDTARLLFDKGFDFDCNCDDVSLMAYLVTTTDGGLSPEKAALTYLEVESFHSLAAILKPLKESLEKLLEETGSVDLYKDIELPLAVLLARIEHTGFLLDEKGLVDYGKALEGQMRQAESEIYRYAGHEFNINSPKQLGVVLFEELKLPHYRKTKSGYSTDVDVLEKLLPFHPIIELILFYRKTAKLKSTYCDGLLSAVSPDGRVHTTFRQTLTKTGRLSSTEPNLQNIPVRTEEGRELRKFFVAQKGYVLIDADYSQIELRILAHISGDEAMIEAFKSGKDIHTSTAARVFGVPESGVTPEMRKRAKAVNFGIVYGIGDYSLSQDLGITKKQASDYIENYLNTYPKVKEYLENIKDKAKKEGYVTTLYGRRRYITELKSTKKQMVAFGERVAMNTPIQGTAADIIKKAMIDAHRAIIQSGLDAKIILQVHDELIVEAKAEDKDKVKEILIRSMENACILSVPLTVDAGIGPNWYDAKN